MKKHVLGVLIATGLTIGVQLPVHSETLSGQVASATYTVSAGKVLEIAMSSNPSRSGYHGYGVPIYYFSLNNYSDQVYSDGKSGVVFKAQNVGETVLDNAICLKDVTKATTKDMELCVFVDDINWALNKDLAQKLGYELGYTYNGEIKAGGNGTKFSTSVFPIKTARDSWVSPGEYTLIGQAVDLIN